MTLLFLTIVFLFAVSSPVIASETPEILTQRLHAQGVEDYSNQKTASAVRAFVRVLLIQPDHRESLALLEQMSRDAHLLDESRRRQIERFLGLIDYLRFTQDYIRRTYAENLDLVDYIRQQAPQTDLEQRLNGLKPLQTLNNLYEIQTALPGEWPATSFHLPQINGRLTALKNERVALLKKMQEINTQLWDMKQRVILESAQSRQVNLTTAFTNKIQRLQQQLTLQQQQLQRQDRALQILTNQFQTTRQDYADMQKRFLKSSRHANSLTQQLADMSLELFERDRDLADQVHQGELLKEELMDYKQRASLTRRIMHEKDQRIKTLTAGASAQPDTEPSADAARPDRLRAMEREIHQLRHHYELAARNLKKQDQHIHELKQTLFERDRTIAQMQQVFMAQDRKLSEMAGMLKIYKIKLSRSESSGPPSQLRRQFVDRQRSRDPDYTNPPAPISIIDPRLPVGHSRDIIYRRTTERIQHLVPRSPRPVWLRP